MLTCIDILNAECYLDRLSKHALVELNLKGKQAVHNDILNGEHL